MHLHGRDRDVTLEQIFFLERTPIIFLGGITLCYA